MSQIYQIDSSSFQYAEVSASLVAASGAIIDFVSASSVTGSFKGDGHNLTSVTASYVLPNPNTTASYANFAGSASFASASNFTNSSSFTSQSISSSWAPQQQDITVNTITASYITSSVIQTQEPINAEDVATKNYVDQINPQGLEAYFRADPDIIPTYYQMHDLSVPLSSSAITLTTSGFSLNDDIFNFISFGVGVTNINEGNFSVHFHAWFTGGGNTSLSVVPEFWLRSAGGLETLIAVERAVALDKTVDKSYDAVITLTSSIVTNPTDRALVKFRASAIAGSPTAFMNVDGKTSAGITIPVPSSNFVLRAGDTMTGNLTAPAFSGSLFGTSSFAISASFAPFVPTISASFASQSLSASWAPVPVSASWASQSISASWAPSNPGTSVSASWAGQSISASFANQSFTAISSSWADTCSVFIYSNTTISLTFVSSASWASQSLWADSASFASRSISSSWAPFVPTISASWASQSLSSSWSPNQGATTLVTASTYQITSSFASRSISASWSPFVATVSASWASESIWSTTASFASRSISASFAPFVPTVSASFSSQSIWSISASFSSQSISASWSPFVPTVSASFSSQSIWSISASFASQSMSSSWAPFVPTISASWASQSLSSSWSPNQGATTLVTASIYPITASWSNNSLTSNVAISSSFASQSISASWAPSLPSNFAISASFASQSISASVIYVAASNSNINFPVVFTSGNGTASQQLYVDGGISFNPSTDTLSTTVVSASTLVGPHTGSQFGTSSWANNAQTSSNGAFAWASIWSTGGTLKSASYNCNITRSAIGIYPVKFINTPSTSQYAAITSCWSGSLQTAPTAALASPVGLTTTGFTMSVVKMTAATPPAADFTSASVAVFTYF